MVFFGVAIVLAIYIIISLTKIIRLVNPLFMAFYLPFAINLPLLVGIIIDNSGMKFIVPLGICLLEFFYIWVQLHVFPIVDRQKAGFRLKALIGSRPILFANIYATIFQAVALPLIFMHRDVFDLPNSVIIANMIYSLGCCFALFLNGTLRALIASKRLGIIKRVIFIFTLWIPLINWIVWGMSARLIKQEYEYGIELREWSKTLVESDSCATKYPILMLHGVAFRDMRYFNYWGRIPRYLKKFGAKLYYGNQEAFATIESNGADVKNRVDEILAETGAEKVNIVAHSKGGLDARYAIYALGISDKVASLTTMNSPHRGCRFADHAIEKLPTSLFNLITKIANSAFRRYGDKNPDFAATIKQFRTEEASKFNEVVSDMPSVYYQSFTSVMSSKKSDRLLSIPYKYIKKFGEPDNDGLVSIESAIWGDFRGVFRSTTVHGISHADIIDMKRQDYKGFNVQDTYIKIVSELKTMGY